MAIDDGAERAVDLSGLKCPLPVLRTRKMLERASSGERFRVISTDPLSAIDIPNLLRETGDVLENQSHDEGRHVFVIRRGTRGTNEQDPA